MESQISVYKLNDLTAGDSSPESASQCDSEAYDASKPDGQRQFLEIVGLLALEDVPIDFDREVIHMEDCKLIVLGLQHRRLSDDPDVLSHFTGDNCFTPEEEAKVMKTLLSIAKSSDPAQLKDCLAQYELYTSM